MDGYMLECVFLHYFDMKCALDMHVYSLVCTVYILVCVHVCRCFSVFVYMCTCVHRIQKCTVWVCGPLCVFSRCVRCTCVYVCLCKCYALFVCVCM